MQKFNFHTHTHYCDGKNAPEDYVLAALEKGFSHLGFSGHAPIPFENTFAIAPDQVKDYCAEIHRLKQKYADRISIALGMEFDFIPVVMENIPQLAQDYGLDYYISAIHLVAAAPNTAPTDYSNDLWFIDGSKIETYDRGLQNLFGGDIRKGVTAFFEQTIAMIQKAKPDVIGHFDKIKMNNKGRYFQETDPWYHVLLMQTLQAIRAAGTICEINTRGIYKQRHPDFYPAQAAWKAMREMNIPVTISSDAHLPQEIDALFCEVLEGLRLAGYKEIYCFENGWNAVGI